MNDITETSKILNHLTQSKYKGILALDLGAKKVGVAYADFGVDIALPLEVLTFGGNKSIFEEKLNQIISTREISVIVIGYSGEETKQKFRSLISTTRRVASLQNQRIEIVFEDESYTTTMADELLKNYGFKRKKRNKIDDMIAAQLILESFIDRLSQYLKFGNKK